MVTRCKAMNASGQPCAGHVRLDDDYCRWHDPERADERREWAVKGGKNRSNRERLKRLWDGEQLTLSQVSGLLSGAMVATLQGEIEPAVLTAIAGGARALIVLQEAEQMAARVTALEAALSGETGRSA